MLAEERTVGDVLGSTRGITFLSRAEDHFRWSMPDDVKCTLAVIIGGILNSFANIILLVHSSGNWLILNSFANTSICTAYLFEKSTAV